MLIDAPEQHQKIVMPIIHQRLFACERIYDIHKDGLLKSYLDITCENEGISEIEALQKILTHE
jgi:hypothetical protein